MSEFDDLIGRVTVRALPENIELRPTATGVEVAEANGWLGFSLPPLLARLYTDVADGGFGPAYTLFSLIGSDRSVVSEYLELRGKSAMQKHPSWPAAVVPILDWGCGMYAAVDCRDPAGQVLMFEPNGYAGGTWDEHWYVDTESLSGWLEDWLADAGWYCDDVIDTEDEREPRLWAQAASRLASDI